MDDNNNEYDLYKKVLPALKCKKSELIKCGYKYLKEQDIWNILITNVWTQENNIALCDLVNDILNTSNDKLLQYYLDNKNK